MLLAESLLGSSSTAPVYIEDVFSTYLYTGTGSAQTITNGIDLSGKGGLVWMKGRSGATDHALYDTARGATFDLASNTTAAQTTQATGLTSFDGNGFSIGALAKINTSAATYASWTFRKQAKFFDVVTYTGNGTAGRTVSHNLGSVPGCIIVKSTSAGGTDWTVFHRSINAGRYGFIVLNQTNAAFTSTAYDWNPTSTTFIPQSWLNDNGATYVAYLFAHDAGGFGATGADNVISCGSFTNTGSALSVNLGYEPQWLLFKLISGGGGDWNLVDNMRGFQVDRNASTVGLYPNLSSAESALGLVGPTSTGFTFDNGGSGQTYIYIAIRRGPMKTPTSGTSVFVPYAYAGSGAGTYTTGINQDLFYAKSRGSSSYVWNWYDRLRGPNLRLQSNATSAETPTTGVTAFNNTSMVFAASDGFSSASPFGGPYIGYALSRAPGFFDVVCYTGTGVARTINHNLGIAPEIYIVKPRTTALASNAWWVNCAYLPTPSDDSLVLNSAGANNTGNGALLWNSTRPTSTVFSIGTYNGVNTSDTTFVAYLFATVAGVSKVFSYTGNGSSQTINCGFTGGARFVLIKRTDSTGNWTVFDSARGIVAGNDPALYLNSTAAEVTTIDAVDTDSSGFIVNQDATLNLNVNSASYIGLAIA